MTEFDLSVGMSKKQVLQLAQNLKESAKTKIINFFDNDKDNQITNVNELAILNSIFDGTGKVKMPTDNTEIGYDARTSGIVTKYNDGIEEWSQLLDYDRDGYADEHHMQQHWTKNGRIMGYQGNDKNLDGVMDKKHFYNIPDFEHIPQYLDSETIEMVDWDDDRVNLSQENNTKKSKYI